jgi:hypothetical protein
MTGGITEPTPFQNRIKRVIAFLFPLSAKKQVQTLLLGLALVYVGSFLGNALPIWNANLITPIAVGYFMGAGIHPLVFMGALATAACIAGISWSLAVLTGDGWDMDYAIAIVINGFNVFVTMSLGDLARRTFNFLRRIKRPAK